MIGLLSLVYAKSTTVHHLLSSQAAMDHVLDLADCYFFTPYIYPVSWPESWAVRQIISLWVVTNVGALLVYLVFGALNFYYVFDHVLMKHPQFIEVGQWMDSQLWYHFQTKVVLNPNFVHLLH